MIVASLRLAGTLVWHARHREVGPVTSRALARLGPAPHPALRCRLLIYDALADIGSGEHPQRALDTMAEVTPLQQSIDDPVLEQECVAMDSHVHYEALRPAEAAALARRAGRLARAQNNLWGAVNVEWMAAATELHLGRLSEGERAMTEVMAEAERAGHLPVVWVCRTFLASARFLTGDLEGASRAAEESHAFAAAIGTPWRFLDDVLIGMIAQRRGRVQEAIARMRSALAAEPTTFWSGISRAHLFYVLAFEHHPAALELLGSDFPRLPAANQAAPLGTWLSLAPTLRAFVHLGRIDDAAAMWPSMEALVRSGLVVHYTLTRTDAGIAAAAAAEWVAGEEHHRIAMQQADTLRSPLARADARDWYAQLLLARGRGSDRARAGALLDEAVTLYDTIGMTTFAARARTLAATA
jgi:hypothetical protein